MKFLIVIIAALSLSSCNTTDIVMAIVTGPELAVQIHEIRPNLPTIFISAYPEIAEHRPPGLRHLEVRQQRLEALDGDVGQDVALPQQPQYTLLFAGSHVSPLQGFVAIIHGLDK